jgi:tripartite-type tricarboxylate transporter receptor subunit TctC
MKLPRRNFLHLAAGAAALPVLSRIARAQAYPTRPVRLIAGFPPRGAASRFAASGQKPTALERLSAGFSGALVSVVA